jgi:RNA-dependent RNA polymerase
VLSVYKNGGKEKRKKDGNQIFSSSVKCYFVRTESGWDRDEPYILSNKTIDEARKMFMHIHTVPTVAKYLARLGSCFYFSQYQLFNTYL